MQFSTHPEPYPPPGRRQSLSWSIRWPRLQWLASSAGGDPIPQ
jgi:hypothetical protein